MLFFDTWQDNISKLEIHYTNIAGEKKIFPITREVCLENYTLLKDVNLERVCQWKEREESGNVQT